MPVKAGIDAAFPHCARVSWMGIFGYSDRRVAGQCEVRISRNSWKMNELTYDGTPLACA